VTSWVDHAIWWHVYPLGFTGAEHTGLPDGIRHRLPVLEEWLDYAVELGCSGLLLGPVFSSSTHGYDTVDHFRIDPRLGDEEDFASLAAACAQRGLRIVLDGVFNHVGRDFPAFQAALAGSTSAARWFRRDPDTGEFACFEGHEQLVVLNHAEPAVQDYVTEVMRYWLDRGAAGWRLDAAYAVPAEFWRTVLPKVRVSYPDAWFFGEVIHGDYAAYAAASGLDAVTQYELWKSVWSSLNDRNFFELAWTLDRHNTFLDGTGLQTFAGNHDVTRLASRLDDERHLGHALALLFTVGGIPSVYYGDEQAFRGIKEERAGGDDEIRPAFPASPAELADAGWPVYRLHQRLIGFRRRHPWLVNARTTVEHLTNTAIAYRSSARSSAQLSARSPAGGQSVLVLLNTGDEPYRFPVDVSALSVADASAAAADPALVPAHGWVILA
jgi:cyclomaltodextrinase / maltogenic alpha-amylase / neopullulanase